ncbi:MAG TPA: hypothetical protein VMI73_23520 [Trebonia sp.]|nr:hypothetical protein [Trebonia sp.]
MDLKDATLMVLSESAGQPAVASLAQVVYNRLAEGGDVDYRLLKDLIGEASGKGVLRAIHAKYSPVAYQAIIMPILDEIGRREPVPPRLRPTGYTDDPESDPLRASVWPPR